MPEQPKQPKNLITFIIFITVVLVAIGGAIYYYINKVVNFSPSVENEATTPCRCKWVSEEDSNKIYAEASGYLQGNNCVFPETFEIGGKEIDQCIEISEFEEVEKAVATHIAGELGPGVIAMSSTPIQPPAVLTEENQSVTFTVDFSLYSLDETAEYTQAEMAISYPDTDKSPEEIIIDLSNDNTTTYTYLENGQTVTGYRVKFLSTWNEVINSGETGLYKVSFRAKDNNNVWTDATTGTLQFVVGNAATGEYYCNNIDIVQTRTTGSSNVTATAVANLPEGYTATYLWKLDVDCSGDIDEDEEFTTATNTITKEYTYPPSGTSEKTCEASVSIELSDGTKIESRSDESCLGYVTLNPLSEMCGDGVLDETEECDPGIKEGQEGYQANCQDDCTILKEEAPEEEIPEEEEKPSEEPPEEDEGKTITTDINISQTCPTCISLQGETPTAEISITVSNSGDSSQTVRAVSNSLPQGFSFTEGSSTINEIPNLDDTGVTIETSGESQLVTWDNKGTGWTITAGDTLMVEFTTEVSTNVTPGTYTNTVTVTPADEDPIQSEKGIVLAVNCEQPETALFSRTLYPILIGTIFLLFASFSYYTGFGTKRFSKMMDQVSDMGLLVTQPQKYRENRIEEKALKEIKRQSKDQRK